MSFFKCSFFAVYGTLTSSKRRRAGDTSCRYSGLRFLKNGNGQLIVFAWSSIVIDTHTLTRERNPRWSLWLLESAKFWRSADKARDREQKKNDRRNGAQAEELVGLEGETRICGALSLRSSPCFLHYFVALLIRDLGLRAKTSQLEARNRAALWITHEEECIV